MCVRACVCVCLCAFLNHSNNVAQLKILARLMPFGPFALLGWLVGCCCLFFKFLIYCLNLSMFECAFYDSLSASFSLFCSSLPVSLLVCLCSFLTNNVAHLCQLFSLDLGAPSQPFVLYL